MSINESSINNISKLVRKNAIKRRQPECPICLDHFNKDNPAHVTRCGHSFHKKCLQDWLRDNRECPLCRSILPLSEHPRLKIKVSYSPTGHLHVDDDGIPVSWKFLNAISYPDKNTVITYEGPYISRSEAYNALHVYYSNLKTRQLITSFRIR